MEKVLDNPVWNALVSGNSYLAGGNERVKYFDEQVSPFAGMVENTHENLVELYNMLPPNRSVFLWAGEQISIPAIWKLVACIPGLQMVYDLSGVPAYQTTGITVLTENNIAEMLALTKLTKPGPFGPRTIEFGNYEGIFAEGQLVAITGQRFHCFDHIEISAVCTHPDWLGKGYAKQLLLSQLTQIVGRTCKPYLHVRSDNERAIHVYQTLGFSVRMPVYFYVLKK